VKKNVVVVGGGIAGLGAAVELLSHGCEVTVIEAAPRFGGRIYTLHEDGTPLELGAEFLHGQSPPLQAALRRAGLLAHEISMENKVFEHGRFRRVDVWEKMSKIIQHIDPAEADCSFAEFLEKKMLRASNRRLAEAFVKGFHAAPPERISAHSLRRAEHAAEHMADPAQSRLDAGYAAFVDFLVRQIREQGGKILERSPVQRIRWQRGRVEVQIEGQSETVNAEAAIVAVSLGVLKAGTIAFEPPPGKNEAVTQIPFGHVVKIILRFRAVCWPKFAFIQAWDEALPTWWTDARGPILVGWAGGPKADKLLQLSRPQLESLALVTIKKIFPKHAGALQNYFISSHYHNWANDPLIRGAYSYLPVGGLDLPKLLAEPVGETLFFAGEATVRDAQTGMVSEAYETGLRAAREVAAAK
jgi:monoamine oxidase